MYAAHGIISIFYGEILDFSKNMLFETDQKLGILEVFSEKSNEKLKIVFSFLLEQKVLSNAVILRYCFP